MSTNGAGNTAHTNNGATSTESTRRARSSGGTSAATKLLAVLSSFAMLVGIGLVGLFTSTVAVPEAQAANGTLPKIDTYPLHPSTDAWWPTSNRFTSPVPVDDQTMYYVNVSPALGYFNQRDGNPLTSLANTLITTATSANTASMPSFTANDWGSTLAVDADANGVRGGAAAYLWSWTNTGVAVSRATGLGVVNPLPTASGTQNAITDATTEAVLRVKNGETAMSWIAVPKQNWFESSVGTAGWSGGEVVQKTGQIFFSGRENSALGTNGQYRMMIFDPRTWQYNYSGQIMPANPGDAIFGDAATSNGGTGSVASDMALDADGNAYILVISGNAAPSFGLGAATRTWLVKVTPSWDQSKPWTYQLVTPLITGPGAGGAAADPDSGSFWGMAFYQGMLYYQYNATTIVAVNPMSGARYNVGGVSGSTTVPNSGSIRDLASGQTAMVLEGVVYNDQNADGDITGDPGLPGQTVALYMKVGDNYVFEGTRTTNDSGTYSFLLGGNGDYIVRLVQPTINGVNAWQTYASASSDQNSVSPQCVASTGISFPTTSTGPCYGNLAAPAVDPAVPTAVTAAGTDISTQPAAMGMYSQVNISTYEDVADADFGVAADLSTGDAAAGPATFPTAPVHNNLGQPVIWLGQNIGTSTDPSTTAPATNNSHSGTDDGVYIKAFDGSKLSLENTVLAGTRTYTITGDVSTNGISPTAGYLSGWVTGAGNSTWNTTAKWTPTIGADGTASGSFTFSTTAPGATAQTVQFRSSISTSQATVPTNSSFQYQASATSTTPWTTYGEIEDYNMQVANAVYRPAAITTGSSGTFNVAGVTLSNVGPTMRVGQAVGVGATQQNLTATVPNNTWSIQDISIKDSESGAEIAHPTFTVTGNTANFSYAPEVGSDAIVLVTYAKAPDPDNSTLTLYRNGTTDKSNTAPVGSNLDAKDGLLATVTVVDTDGQSLDGQKVTFSNKTPSFVTIDALTCTTGADGTCSVHVTSDTAGTYPGEITAVIGSGSQAITAKGAPADVTFTALKGDPTKSNLLVEPATIQTVGNTFTATAQVKDSLANTVAGQEVRFTVTKENGDPVDSNTQLSASYCNTVAPEGKCPVTLTSTKAGRYTITATIEDPANPGTWVGITTGSPVTVEFAPGPVDPSKTIVEVKAGDNGKPNDGITPDVITATTTDQYGNPVSATVQISTNDNTLALAGDGRIVTDSATGVGTLNATSRTAGDHAATAAISGTPVGTGANLTLTFTAMQALPDHSILTLTTTDQPTGVTNPVSTGSQVTATVEARDTNDTPVGGVLVNFAIGGPTGPGATYATISNSASCTTESDTSNANFGKCSVTVTDRRAETVTVYARLNSASDTEIVNSPTPVTFVATTVDPGHSTIVAVPTTVAADGANTSLITVSLMDQYDNLVKNPANTVVISSNRSGDTVDDTLNKGDGTYTTTIKSSTSGLATLSYTLNGEAQTKTATVNFSVTAISAIESSWTVTPTTSATSGTDPIANGNSTGSDYYTAVLTARDSSGNPLTNLDLSSIVFSASMPQVTHTEVTNTGNGTYTVQYSTTKAGNPTASVTVNGAVIGSNRGSDAETALPIPFQSGPVCFPTAVDDPNCQTWAEVYVDNALADGTDTDTIRMYAFDKDGNPATATFTLLNLSDATLSGTSAPTDPTTGIATVTATSRTDGAKQVQVNMNGTLLKNPENGMLTLHFTFGAVSDTTSTLAITPTTSQPAGSTFTATVTAKDGSGLTVPNATITVTVDKNAKMVVDGQEYTSYPCVTNSSGVCTVAITDRTAETVTVHATVPKNGSPADISGSPATAIFTPGTVVSSSTIVASPTSGIPSDGTSSSTITVTLFDQYGNVITADHIVDLTPSMGAVSSITHNANGTYTANLTSTTEGTSVVSYKVDGANGTGGTASVSFVDTSVHVFSSTNSTWSVAATTSAPSGTQPIANGNAATDYYTATLVSKDQKGDPFNLDPSKIALTVDPSTGVKIWDVQDQGNATYTMKITSTKAGSALANVSYNGSDAVTPLNQNIPFQAGTICIPGVPDATNQCSGDLNTTTRAYVYPDGALADGTHTDTINVQAFDATGNPVAATFTLASKDGDSRVRDASVAVLAGVGTNTTTATSTLAGAHLVTVAVNGTPLPDLTVNFTQTEIDTQASTLAVDRTTQAAGSPVTATVTARDSGGRVIPNALIQVQVNKSATLGDDKVTTYDCWTDADGVCQVAINDTTAETVSVTAAVSAGPISGSPQNVTFTAAAADSTKSTIAASPTSRVANGSESSVVTVTLKDQYGNQLTTGGDSVTMSQSIGTLTNVTDNHDGTYKAYLSSTTPGVSTVGFTVNGADGTTTASVTFEESPFCAGYSNWTVTSSTGATPAANGTDYWTGTLNAKDCYGNSLSGLDETKVRFVASSSDVTVSAATNNHNGTYTATFTSLKAGNPVANVTYDNSAQVAPLNQNIPFQAGTICIPTAPTDCSGDPATQTRAWVQPNGALANGTATDTINVQAFDENGNPVDGTFTLSGDGAVTLGLTQIQVVAGNGKATTTATSTVPGDHTVGVSVNGTALPDVIANFLQTAIDLTQSTLTVAPQTQAAGQSVTATVTAKDSDGRTLSDVPIQITVNNSATIGDGTAQSVECRTLPDGTCSVVLTDQKAELVSVTAEANEGPISGSPKSVTFTPTTVSPITSTITADPTSRTANGSEASVITVTAKDEYGNTLTTGGSTVTMSATNNAHLTNVRDNGDGTYTANLTSTTPGVSTVSFTVNGEAGTNTADVTFVAGDFCAASSTWSVVPTTTAASGAPVANGNDSTDYWTATLNAKDCFGVALTGLDTTQVKFQPESSDVTVSEVTNNNDGSYTAKFTSTTALNTKASVIYGGSAKVGPTTDQNISFQAGPVCVPTTPTDCSGDPATQTRAWVEPNGAKADGSATDTINVQAFDANGNPRASVFTLTGDGQVNLASGTVSTTADTGKNTTTATSRVSGNHTVTASVDGTALPDLTLIYVPSDVSATMSTLEVDTPVQTAGNPITVTVTANDAGGTALAGIPVQIAVNNSATIGAGQVTTYPCVTTADGTCSVAINDTKAEPVTITAKVNVAGENVNVTGSPKTVNFVVGPPDPDQSTIAADQLSRVNDGVQTSVVTVTLKDHYGNQLTTGGETVTLSKTLGDLTSVKDNDDGTYTANLTSTVAGSSTIRYAVDGTNGTDTVTVVFIDTTPPPIPTVTSPKPGAQINDPTPEVIGTAEAGSTVTVRDKDTNTVLCTAVANANGNFSCTVSPDTELGDGPHTLAVTAADPSGNASPAAEVLVNIDTVPPMVPAIDKANSTEISGRADPGSVITVTVPGAEPKTTVADENGVWLVTTPAGAIDDSEVQATATDPAGNESEPGTAKIDITAPAKPDIQVANGTEISGQAEAGSTVTVRVPGVDTPFRVTASEDGTWSIDTPAGATDNGQVTATATDPAGNVSPQATHDLDTTPPAEPTIDVANGKEISGTADPGSTVTITVPGEPDTTVTVPVNNDGKWTTPTPANATDNSEVTATSTDPAGNDSTQASKVIDTTPPAQPNVDVANATEVKGGPGSAEPGSNVTVTFPNGTKSSTKAAEDGSYSVVTPPNTPDGQITVTATDAAGNVSEPTTQDIDTTPPSEPTIDKANADVISGTADPGSTVTVTVPGHPGDITVQVADDGKWSIETPEDATDNGTIHAVATDPAGNVSPEAIKVLDTTAPDQPEITTANGTEISGTADPGTTVTVTVPGEPDTTVKVPVGDDGTWTIPTPPSATDGGTVTVVATDEAGNESEPATKDIDTTAPGQPEITTANGTEISGTADPGTTVTITVPGEPDTTVKIPVGDDGTWTIPTPEGTTDGGTITVVATDEAGNDSAPATKDIDTTPPTEPEITTANGTEISGTADPDSTVTITVPGQPGEPDITLRVGPVGPDGTWSVDTPEGAGDGTMHVTATDPAGNESPEVTQHLDVTAPPVPEVNASPTQIWGTAEPGSTVEITVPGVDQPITVGPVGDDRTWSIPVPEGAHNGTVTVTATDEAGNTSEPGTAELDKVGPEVPMPSINHANATHVAGDAGSTAAGNVITVTFPDGQVKTTTAAVNGSWSIPTPAKADGTKMQSGTVSATATDATTHVVSEPRTHDLDTDVPASPKIDVANGTEIAGNEGAAEPGSTVTVTWPDGSTTPVVANEDGSYSVPTQPGLPDGSTITVTVTDPAGNVSEPVQRSVDTQGPAKPIIETANGTVISGTAEKGSTITVTVPSADGPVTVTTTADGNGNWSVDTPESAVEGTVTVVATDHAGNDSPKATRYIDVDAPSAPSVETANATEVSGIAEKGSTVTVVFPDGTKRIATADSVTGAYTVTTPAGMIDGGKVTVTATDEAGNVSEPTIKDLDTGAPNDPTIDRADGVQISGTSDPNSTVVIVVPGIDNPIKVTVGDNGKWSINTPSGATDGTVRVTAMDPAGNVSGEVTRTIDVTAPTTPKVNPSNGSEVTGSGDPGSQITITDENGDTVGCKNADGTVSPSATIDEDGKFICVPDKVLTPGSSITVVAKDASGLPSGKVTVTIGNVSITVAYAERHHLDNQTVTGERFNVGEQVCLVVHSDPVNVGCEAADDTGTVTFTFPVPTTMDYGDHTATLTGQSSQLSASTSFAVVNTPEIRTAGTSQPNSDAMMWAVMIAMITGSTVAAMGIRRLKVTK